jgi:hypothetical protein
MKQFLVICLTLLLAPFYSMSQLTGSFDVPSSNYPNFQAVVDSLNTYGVGANGVDFIISGDQTFNETPLTLTASGEQNGRINISWDGQGAKPILNFTATAAASEAGITLLGSDFVTIDGLDIRSADGLLEQGIYLTNASATDGAHFNIVSNVDITLDKENVNQTEAFRVSPAIEAVTIEGSTNNNHFYNNSIQNTFIGYSFGGNNSNTQLMSFGNEVGTEGDGASTISDIVMCGVLMDDQNGFRLFNTTIQDLTRIGSGTTAPAAISTMSGNPSEPLTNEFEIFNNRIESIASSFTSSYGMYLSARKSTHNVYNNVITGVTATGGGSNTADGIMVFATDVTANIYNNMISDIAAPASALSGNAATRGINIRTFGTAQIFYNSVLLQYTATNEAHTSAAMCVYNNDDFVDMRNNIFVNLTTLPDNPSGIATALFKRTPALDNIAQSTDNNIYYAGTPSENNTIFYGYSSTSPAIDQTLSDYQTRAGNFDQNSLTENVPFVGSDDLHIQPLEITQARENASLITDPFVISEDIDGTERDSQTPDIGADEIANPYPNQVENMIPTATDTAIIYLRGSSDEYVNVLSFDFYPDEQYTTPVAFKIYHWSQDETYLTGRETIINYVEGQTHYEIETSEALDPLCEETSYWTIIPTVDIDNGPETPDTEEISFYITCSSSINENDNIGFRIYPNPTFGVVNFSAPIKAKSHLHVFSTEGKLVYSAELSSGQQSVDLSDLDKGFYVAQITDENKSTIYKITIVR